jgi:hypothetical protein
VKQARRPNQRRSNVFPAKTKKAGYLPTAQFPGKRRMEGTVRERKLLDAPTFPEARGKACKLARNVR